MDVLNGLIFPLAGAFYDLYMLIVIPGMATVGDLLAEGVFVAEYFNPYTNVNMSVPIPSIIEALVELSSKITDIPVADLDITVFALILLLVGLSFFLIIIVKVIAMLLVQD